MKDFCFKPERQNIPLRIFIFLETLQTFLSTFFVVNFQILIFATFLASNVSHTGHITQLIE